jgi:hypothetical protein
LLHARTQRSTAQMRAGHCGVLTLGSFIRDSSLAGFPALNDTAVIRRPSHNIRVRPRAA